MTDTPASDGEAIAAYAAATIIAFRTLIHCLQDNGVLRQGEFPDAISRHVEAAKTKPSERALAILRDLRHVLLD